MFTQDAVFSFIHMMKGAMNDRRRVFSSNAQLDWLGVAYCVTRTSAVSRRSIYNSMGSPGAYVKWLDFSDNLYLTMDSYSEFISD